MTGARAARDRLAHAFPDSLDAVDAILEATRSMTDAPESASERFLNGAYNLLRAAEGVYTGCGDAQYHPNKLADLLLQWCGEQLAGGSLGQPVDSRFVLPGTDSWNYFRRWCNLEHEISYKRLETAFGKSPYRECLESGEAVDSGEERPATRLDSLYAYNNGIRPPSWPGEKPLSVAEIMERRKKPRHRTEERPVTPLLFRDGTPIPTWPGDKPRTVPEIMAQRIRHVQKAR